MESFLIGVPFLVISIYFIYSVGVLIECMAKIIKDKCTVLDKKIIINSSSISLAIIFIFYLVQLIFRTFVEWIYSANSYIPTIMSGTGIVNSGGSNPIHIESAAFILIVFSFSYNLMKYKHKLVSKKVYYFTVFTIICLIVMLIALAINQIAGF